jgi:aryl-alcohol dehydrogenase-like predicted oxidoreductase
VSQTILGSRVGLGTSALHHLPRLKQKLALLDAAFESGIRYFDTAPLYGHECAERVLGRFVRDRHLRSSVILATKIGLSPNQIVSAVPPLLLPYIALRSFTTRLHLVRPSVWQPRRDYSPSYLVRRVERSLRLMGLDYLDIVYLHEPMINELQALDALAEVAQSLKKRGLVRAFGVSVQYEVAQWLHSRAPELTEVLQVEVPSQPDVELKNWFSRNATVTFGHFRMLGGECSRLPRDERLQMVTKRAVELNPFGTILFSSTNKSHVSEFVSAISAADKQRQESNHIY